MRTSASWTASGGAPRAARRGRRAGAAGAAAAQTQAPPWRDAKVTFECPSPIGSASSGPSPRPRRQGTPPAGGGPAAARAPARRPPRACRRWPSSPGTVPSYRNPGRVGGPGDFLMRSHSSPSRSSPARRAGRQAVAAPGDDLRGARRAARRQRGATRRSTRSAASASPRSASSSTGSSSRPARTARPSRSFDASDPRPIRRSGGSTADRGRRGARHQGHAHAHRPGAALGDEEQEGRPEPAKRAGSSGSS